MGLMGFLMRTTDIAALREESLNLHGKFHVDAFISALITNLEAEGQRADKLQRWKDLMLENSSVANENQRLKDEIEALKGEKMAVGEIYADRHMNTMLEPIVIKEVRWFVRMPDAGTKLFAHLPVSIAIEAAGGKVAK